MTFSPFLAPERDNALKIGRAKTATQYLVLPGCFITSFTTLTPTANEDWYTPIYVQTPIVVDQLVCAVTTLDAGDNVRLGLYRADTDWQPVGPPLADSGDISTATTGLKTYTPTTPVYLARGRYLTVINQSGIADFQGMVAGAPGTAAIEPTAMNQNSIRWRVGRAHAAFPTPGTAWTTVTSASNNPIHLIAFRVLTP